LRSAAPERHTALLRLLLREAVQPGLEVQVLPAGEERIERRLLQRDADDAPDLVALGRDVEAADGRMPSARRQESDEHLDRGRLAGAVRAEEAVDLPGLDVQVDAVDGARSLLVLADETLDLDCVLGHRSRTLSRRDARVKRLLPERPCARLVASS
jgi:hypothetical protein